MLPVEPFREWLAMIVVKYGSVEAAEGAVGLRARTIRRFVSPKGIYEVTQQYVSLDLVDFAVCHEGNHGLWEIYPDWCATGYGIAPMEIGYQGSLFDMA